MKLRSHSLASKMNPIDNNSTTKPGEGWTNNEIPPQYRTVVSKSSVLELYRSNRRLIQTSSSWSRTGLSDPNDPIAKSGRSSIDDDKNTITNNDKEKNDVEEEKTVIRALTAQLCEVFQNVHGWMPGTGGGLSIRTSDGKSVFTTPSGLQKEDMIGDDMFELDAATGKVITPPLGNSSSLQLSSMTSLWLLVYRLRPSARCVIHTHSMNSVLASLLNEGEEMLPKNDGKNNSNIRELVVTHQEMIKGVGGHAYDSTLKIPIIDNKSSEGALAPDMERAILQYPKCNAVLVARHGVYVWGDSWEEAKTRLESFDFLFEFCVKLKSTLNINPGDHPFQKEKDVKGMKRKRDEGKV